VRGSDGAIGFNVYSERQGGRDVCVGPAYETIVFTGGPGSDDLFLEGGRRVIDFGQTEPREPFGPVPATIAVDASGGSAEDDLIGHPGEDRLSGGGGSDKLVGGRKSDVLIGGPERDKLVAGPGADEVDATTPFPTDSEPARRDDVDCGGGRDVVFADRFDKLWGCETVRRR